MLQSGQRRALSSGSRTLAYKFFWPVFNVVAFVGATLLCWHISPKKGDEGVIYLARIGLPVIGIGSTAYGIWSGKRLKRVQMDDNGLYVSNYFEEISLSFSDIEACEVKWEGKNRWNPIVTIDLNVVTPMGRQITFMAKLPWNNSHSIVAELREKRDAAKIKAEG